MLPSRTHHTQLSTTHITYVAPIDKHSPDQTRAKAGSAPEGPGSGSRGAGAAPRRPQARPDTTAQEHKVAEGTRSLTSDSQARLANIVFARVTCGTRRSRQTSSAEFDSIQGRGTLGCAHVTWASLLDTLVCEMQAVRSHVLKPTHTRLRSPKPAAFTLFHRISCKVLYVSLLHRYYGCRKPSRSAPSSKPGQVSNGWQGAATAGARYDRYDASDLTDINDVSRMCACR